MKNCLAGAAFVIAALSAASANLCWSGDFVVTYQHNLSDFSGALPFSDARIYADRQHDEVYVLDGESVRVFNAAGMEVYSFVIHPDLGNVRDIAVDSSGDILILAYRQPDTGRAPEYFVIRCNYRGEPQERIPIQALPTETSSFLPHNMFLRNGRFLLVDRVQMTAVVTDRSGAIEQILDLAELIGVKDEDRPNTIIFGVNLDAEGNLLLTVPVMFKAFIISPSGQVSSFGKVGSAPGLFGIPGGIARDDQGNFFVSDRLRHVVMMFDGAYRFIREFGYRGDKPENLARPTDVVVGGAGRLYVSQLRNRGVSVFSVTTN